MISLKAGPAIPFPVLSRREVFAQAWPIIVGQSLIPMVGLVDATVIGRTGTATALAGVALGATIINLVFWTFGFLRMGVTGLTAQAQGEGNEPLVRATLLRAGAVGAMLGLALLLFSPVIVPVSLLAMHVPEASRAAARDFTQLRFIGAPAALAFYAVNGWLIGLGRTRLALACQVVLNGINIILDVLFVGILHLGAAGVGLGTALAEWSALAAGVIAVRHVLGPRWYHTRAHHGERLFASTHMRRLVAVNTDIMVRTLAILMLFTWFSRAGARLGPVPLAANHVLMQLVGISAFVLDGFAFTAEHRVGVAIGAGSVAAVRRAVRLTCEFSLVGGIAFFALFATAGPILIDLVASDPAVRGMARAMLLFCALVPLIGMPSWLLDGIFIGATKGRILRNAALASLVLYLVTDLLLRGLGDRGAWLALLSGYAYRAFTLGLFLPALLRSVRRPIAGSGESIPRP